MKVYYNGNAENVKLKVDLNYLEYFFNNRTLCNVLKQFSQKRIYS